MNKELIKLAYKAGHDQALIDMEKSAKREKLDFMAAIAAFRKFLRRGVKPDTTKLPSGLAKMLGTTGVVSSGTGVRAMNPADRLAFVGASNISGVKHRAVFPNKSHYRPLGGILGEHAVNRPSTLVQDTVGTPRKLVPLANIGPVH